MGTCFLYGNSGGGGKAFAVIGVTYPQGSICTCSDGTKTLKLKDTSGQGFFLIPYAGTWTVTATDVTNTKSEAVSITTDGQSVSLTLNYSTVIYNLGWTDKATSFSHYYISVTGSAASDDKKPISVSYSGGYIVMSRVLWNGRACAYTDVAYDLTDINTISCKTAAIGSGNPIYFGVGKAKTIDAAAKVQLTESDTEYNLDVSSLNGEYVIGFYGPDSGAANWTWSNRQIESFWIE